MDQSVPATLNDAISSEPMWLRVWVLTLVFTHLAAVLFMIHRRDSGWAVRVEAIAIVASFFLAAVAMNWLFHQVGYVRLLGLAHLLFWTPVYVWIFLRRKTIGRGSMFGEYIIVYLIIVGVSLGIDLIDVVRYLLGDGELFNRWAGV